MIFSYHTALQSEIKLRKRWNVHKTDYSILFIFLQNNLLPVLKSFFFDGGQNIEGVVMIDGNHLECKEIQNFILLDKGRSPDEQSVILVENNELRGFGYVAVDEAVSHPDDLKRYIKPYPSNTDAIRIIRMFLDEKKGLKKIIL